MIKVEIGQYYEVNKGSLKARFSLVIYPEGQKILDCTHFVRDNEQWFNFPQKEIKHNDGRKTEYLPLISYLNKDYREQLKIAVLTELKKISTKNTHEKQRNTSNTPAASTVPNKPSVSCPELPF